MKIILSPAKKMNVDTDAPKPTGVPCFIGRTEEILSLLRDKSRDELKTLWGCNDQIAEQNYERIEKMNLYRQLTPAVLSYEGIAYQYLTPADKYITVTFCEKSGGKLVTKGTYAKMARGEMVRYMAENQIETPEQIKGFDRLGYVFRGELSGDREYVFERV